MTRIQQTVEADVPLEAAFDYIADFDHANEWDPNTTEARRLDGGQIGPGTRFALRVRMGSRTAPMEYRITEYERPRRIVLAGTGASVSSIDDIRFERHGDRTVVHYRAEIRLVGVLRLIQPFLGGTFANIGRDAAAGMARELARLAAHPEGTAR